MPDLETLLYSVLLLNDDETPMEFVVHVMEPFSTWIMTRPSRGCFSSITKDSRSAVAILTN